MKSKARPNFGLEKFYENGSREAPEIFKIGDLNGDWCMGRRGFLGTSAVGAAAMWSLLGCSGGEDSPEKAVDGKCQTDILAHRSGVTSIAYSPDGKLLVSGGNDSKVKLWDMPSGRLAKTWGEHRQGITSVCFDPAGKQVASGCSGGSIKIWDASSGELMEDLKIESSIEFMVLGLNGQLLVSNPLEYKFKAWRLPSRNPTEIHTGLITSLALRPDGKLFATAHWPH